MRWGWSLLRCGMNLRQPDEPWGIAATRLMSSLEASEWDLAVEVAANQVLPLVEACGAGPRLSGAVALSREGARAFGRGAESRSLSAWIDDFRTAIEPLEALPQFATLAPEYDPEHRVVCVFLRSVAQILVRHDEGFRGDPQAVAYSVAELHKSVLFVDPLFRRDMRRSEARSLPLQVALGDAWLSICAERQGRSRAIELAAELGRYLLLQATGTP